MPTSFVYEWWIRLYFTVLRPMLKWFIRNVTGKCELLRITYEEQDKAKRAKRIESSLNISNVAELKTCVKDTDFDVDDVVKQLMVTKGIVPEIHAEFEASIKDSLLRIKAYNTIIKEVEALRKVKYDSETKEHEQTLEKLWDLYNEGTPLPERVGPHWGDMGFQGHDPKTDFRGMGMLGLQQMIFFAENFSASAKQVLSQSQHPKYGFSFAIVAINITHMSLDLLHKRNLRSHFYSLDKQEPGMEDFHLVYCYLLYEFTQFWQGEKPRDIMEFGRLRDKFNKQVKAKLKEDHPLLRSEFMYRA